MRNSKRLLGFFPTIFLHLIAPHGVFAQSVSAPAKPSASQQPSKPQAPKTATVGPAAPQSTHYPILLLAFGSDPTWNLRIGIKGPERFDRMNYPPITLEPAEVTHESAANSWTYHAKDTATGATVAVHLTRESCSGSTPPVTSAPTASPATAAPPGETKFTFRASVDHSQIGILNGCARVAAELFPKINNQATDDDDDAKPKPAVSTVSNFKSPVAVAYQTSSDQLIMKRGSIVKIVVQNGHQPSVSHDGKRLLYTLDEKNPEHAISLYDSATGKSTELLRGAVQRAFWSPEDTRLAFEKFVDGKWQLWMAPIDSPDKAVCLYPGDILAVHGWVDAHTILVDDPQQLSWVGDDGIIRQTAAENDILGEAFRFSSGNTFRVHPLNPDLLLVDADWSKPPAGFPVDSQLGNSAGFFLYELRSKRRVILSPPGMYAINADWSRDGLQIFFTGSDQSRHSATYRIFWDGTGLRKHMDGVDFVVGQ